MSRWIEGIWYRREQWADIKKMSWRELRYLGGIHERMTRAEEDRAEQMTEALEGR